MVLLGDSDSGGLAQLWGLCIAWPGHQVLSLLLCLSFPEAIQEGVSLGESTNLLSLAALSYTGV